ncbi:zinc finger protein 271 [Bombyx mori]|uniref:Zinc finger protein 865 n=1 Tax=Bombyx mori TaxID=7091 RepID=A0A8R2QVQ9_BOMMO|nr:zinc finger protein 271 [Bombyx mori]
MEVFLYNSTVCRLCGEENDNGTVLYVLEDNNTSLSEIVNTYLPIKVSDDGQLPRTICPGCTIQLEATVEFLNLIIKGQKTLRELHQREIEYKKSTLKSTEEVITEDIVYEVNTTDGVYQDDHIVALQVAGLEKPKRKRGRPPKKQKTPEELIQEAAAREEQLKAKKRNEKEEELNGKRRRKTPTRFKEVVQGKELEKIFKEEGVIDDELDGDIKSEVVMDSKSTSQEEEVIGHREDSGELVVVVKGKGRGRPKGRLRPKQEQCAICGASYSCVGRYMSHVAAHGPVLYQCAACLLALPNRLTFTQHQRDHAHAGQRVIPCTARQLAEAQEKLESSNQMGIVSIENIAKDTAASADALPDLDPEPPGTTTGQAEIVNDNAPKTEPVDPLGADATEDLDTNENKEIVLKTDEDESTDMVQFNSKGKPKLKCNHCDKLFSSKQSKSVHIKAVHRGERAHACGECGARFAYPRSLALHAATHRRHSAARYACDLCGKVLNHPSSVVYHKESEHAGQRYVCSKCGKNFKHKQLLQRHQLVHTQNRPFICKVCNTAFKTKANLVNHQILHTGVKKYACEICKQKFAHKTSLTLHLRRHTGLKPFTCNTCGKSFTQKGNLSEHERIHTGEKPFKCALCPRRFTTSSQHRLHVQRHNAGTPFACSSCPKRFVSGASRAAHERRMAGGAAHSCPHCERTFCERWALTKHMRRHTGERPFRCHHCPRAFADASNLNKHRKHVHKQISLLTSANQPVEVQQREEQERVVYVAYDVDDADSPSFHILDPEQAESLDESKVVSTLYSEESLLTSRADPVPVTDEQGNPLHFTMQDGTRLAITSSDGKTLQVVTEDGQTIPVEINGFAEDEELQSQDTIVHQLDLHKSVAAAEPVTHFFTIV